MMGEGERNARKENQMNKTSTKTSAILNVLRDSRRGLSARYVANRTGLSETTARNYLRQMVSAGEVIEAGKVGRGAVRYDIARDRRHEPTARRWSTFAKASAERIEEREDESELRALRKEYATIRRRALNAADTPDDYTAADFDRAARAMVADDPTPEMWVKLASRVEVPCLRCNATGAYGGATGHGDCFRCGGKGRQDDSDRRRNYGYDNNRSI